LSRPPIEDLGPLPDRPAEGFYVRVAKPIGDGCFALLALILVSPVLLMIGTAIAIGSRGGVFFRQERIGLLGRRFEILKFRTMVPGAEGMGTGMLVQEKDPRVTRIGALLRATSLDELPQLWNILRGDMSFVGPRPTLAYQVRQYDARQRQRLRLRPGVTGLAQVSGRKSIPWDERIRIDIEYLRHVSPALDLKILLRTIGVVLGAKDPPAQAEYWSRTAAPKPEDGSDGGKESQGGDHDSRSTAAR
jgi:lipopolysaccharide/colanic/teichoic acid biosynthesis glycosyltransferase